MPRALRIALLVWPAYAYFRGVLRGISHFAHQHPDWTLIIQPNTEAAARGLARQSVAGVIADLDTPAMARTLARLGKPTVAISHMIPAANVPRVCVDDEAVGQLAAEHFLGHGFASFAYYGIAGRAFSAARGEGFRKAVVARGGRFSDLLEARPKVLRATSPQRIAAITAAWLGSLPKPVGILAASDAHGFELAEICRHAGLRIPDEVGLIGVDDDELFCSLVAPPLSSVIVSSEAIGFEAAGLLGRLLAGHKPPPEPVLIRPLGIATRQSSDVYASDDPDVLAATRFIRDHADRAMGVTDILAAVPCSRSTLERKFRLALGRTMLEEIRRVRVERAAELLAKTDLSMSAIAARTGFGDQAWFCTTFRQVTGHAPTAYRRRCRPQPGR